MLMALQDSAVFRLATERRRRWQREMSGFSLVPEVIGAEVAAGDSMFDGAGRAIFIGVSTGLLTWLFTRTLDRMFNVSGGK